MKVLGFYDGARSITVHFYPRMITFNRFVGDMRRPASLISFVASLRSVWKGIVTINYPLLGSLLLRGFTSCPPAPPDLVGF